MQKEMIACIILGVTFISFILEKVPLVITALCAMLAMYFTGILSFQEAFSGFSNNVVLMIMGTQIIGAALSQNGLSSFTLKALNRLFNGKRKFGEKEFIIMSGLLIALLSTVINPTLMVLLFCDIIDELSLKKEYGITRRNTYYPLAVASVAGCMFTSISATSIVITSGLMMESPIGRGLHFFEPMVMGVPYMIVYLVFFSTFGYKMEQKFFDFTETEIEKNDFSIETPVLDKRKMYLTLTVFVICILLFIFSDFAVGAVSLMGAAVLIITGCISTKTAFSSVKWQIVVLLSACLGFARGIEASGVSSLIADALIYILGDLIRTPIYLCVIAMITGSIISNFMNNASASTLIVPIFLNIAQSMNAPLLPVAIAAGLGTNLDSATPICSTVFTMVSSVGYRFKDYLRMGIVINILAVAACTVSLYLVYFI